MLRKVKSCDGCPFESFSEREGGWCNATDDNRGLEDCEPNPYEAAPDWCPLRAGPVTVELDEGVE